MPELTIRPVYSKKDEKRFVRFQWEPNRGNPYWVPPLLMDRMKLINRKKNPFYKHAQMELFLAERGGEPVGRIGAIVNDNHNKEHNENIGFFGFFECVDDQSVANALLDAAKAWLTAKGVTAMRGPVSPSVNDDYGLLVEGFDKRPAVMMVYNPPYYEKLLLGYGLKQIKDLYAFYVHSDKVFTEKLKRGVEIVAKRENLVVRSLNMKDFDNEVQLIRDLYTRGWSKNWGEVPMTEEEFRYVAHDLKAVVDPHLVIIAESKGKPVGFGMSLPDLNMVLKDNKRGYFIPGLIRLLLFKKRINFIRIIILGVLPELQRSGIGGVLFYETGRRAVEHGYFHGEASWVLDDNMLMIRGAELLRGERYKTYRLYQMPLSQ